MAPKKPLATGDDGSGNRYPDRSIIWDADQVPESLQVPVPERHEPPCQGDS